MEPGLPSLVARRTFSTIIRKTGLRVIDEHVGGQLFSVGTFPRDRGDVMRIRKIANFEEVCEEINKHFLWELSPFFPEVGLSILNEGRNRWCNLIRCPLHKEKTASFRYDANAGFFHCYGCGKSGNLITFYSELSGKSFRYSVIRLAKFFQIKLVWENKKVDPKKKQERLDPEAYFEICILWERIKGEDEEGEEDSIPF